ncbi:MAG: hypothetical protein OXH52_18640 [Gammaproteobacteria bacterium]|nr:hypothetical protein [Gammaproteobacteria bacterium]
MTQQQVHGLAWIEAGYQGWVLFLEAFEVGRTRIPQLCACVASRVERILRIRSGFPLAVVPEVRDNHLARAAPASATPESLHQAWPWREFSDQQGRGHIHAGFDHLRGNDDAIRARGAGIPTEEPIAPAASFGGTESAVGQTDIRVRASERPVAPQRRPHIRGQTRYSLPGAIGLSMT